MPTTIPYPSTHSLQARQCDALCNEIREGILLVNAQRDGANWMLTIRDMQAGLRPMMWPGRLLVNQGDFERVQEAMTRWVRTPGQAP